MNTFRNSLYLLLLFVLLFSNCATQDYGYREVQQNDGDYYSAQGIPPAYIPPYGYCRVWYPDRSLSQQPAYVRYPISARQVPRGAWVISRPRGSGGRYVVEEYDGYRTGVVKRKREYYVSSDQDANPQENRTTNKWSDSQNNRDDGNRMSKRQADESQKSDKFSDQQNVGRSERKMNPQTGNGQDMKSQKPLPSGNDMKRRTAPQNPEIKKEGKIKRGGN
ncbi:MAG: hypothetical protein H7246_13155 [Phycisphaerae bacterium]|nr:hypothetical protein [Saprospiraceae bacterium]